VHSMEHGNLQTGGVLDHERWKTWFVDHGNGEVCCFMQNGDLL